MRTWIEPSVKKPGDCLECYNHFHVLVRNMPTLTNTFYLHFLPHETPIYFSLFFFFSFWDK